jgi:hypothetical protein
VVSLKYLPFYLREITPGTNWIGGWLCPRSSVDDVEKKKFLPYRDSNSNPSVVEPVASHCKPCRDDPF